MLKSEPYIIAGTDIGYDAGIYRGHIQDVREAIGEIERLHNVNREHARRVLEKLIRGVYLATRRLYDPLVDQEKMNTVEAKDNDYLTDLGDLEMKCQRGLFLD